MKYVLRILGFIVLLIISIEVIHLLVLVFPHPFFAHRVSFGTVHFHSDAPIESQDAEAFQQLTEHLSSNPLFDPSRTHRVFLAESERLYAVYSFLAGKNSTSQGFNVEPTGNVFISMPFINQIRSRYGPQFKYTLLEGSMSHIILHELMHTLTTDELGFWTSRKLPSWKREGYAEYGASIARKDADLDFDFLKHIDLLYNQTSIAPIRLHYLRSQLLIHYLIEIEGLDVDSIMAPGISEREATTRMLQWERNQRGGKTIP